MHVPHCDNPAMEGRPLHPSALQRLCTCSFDMFSLSILDGPCNAPRSANCIHSTSPGLPYHDTGSCQLPMTMLQSFLIFTRD
jgi:hypothetical protein